MSINDPLSFLLPEDLAVQIGERVRARRLAANLTRKTLAKQSGVPEPTLRKFEVTGVISFVNWQMRWVVWMISVSCSLQERQ